MKKETAKKLLKLNYDLYEQEAGDFSDTRQEIWEKPILDLVKTIKPKSQVLDLGCGNARLYQTLRDMKIDYLGIDTSKTLIKINQKKYPEARFEVGDSLSMKYKNRFNYIISLAVLHHIPSERLQLKFLKNIYQSLKTNGQILISVWNRHQNKYQKYINSPKPFKDMAKNDTIVPWRKSGYFRYIYAFTAIELKKLAQEAGFKKIKCYYADKYGKTDKNKGLNIYLQGIK